MKQAADFAYENELDLSSLITPSTFIPFQEPTPSTPTIHCAGAENDGRQRIRETTTTDEITNEDVEPKNKKAKHREIERQRRQEVTSLFKNLRYILPSQYIKGKRSSSDHVQEAVNYIKDLENKIKEMSEKRDRIKRSISHSSSTGECSIRSLESSYCSCDGDTHIDVKVRTCLVGIEIVASCCFRQESSLSSILQLLVQEQCLDVVSCISSRLHPRFIHTIVCEINAKSLVVLVHQPPTFTYMDEFLSRPYHGSSLLRSISSRGVPSRPMRRPDRTAAREKQSRERIAVEIDPPTGERTDRRRGRSSGKREAMEEMARDKRKRSHSRSPWSNTPRVHRHEMKDGVNEICPRNHRPFPSRHVHVKDLLPTVRRSPHTMFLGFSYKTYFAVVPLGRYVAGNLIDGSRD
ncbi:hypothetical protein Bca4012_096857 [Brassica carinata]